MGITQTVDSITEHMNRLADEYILRSIGYGRLGYPAGDRLFIANAKLIPVVEFYRNTKAQFLDSTGTYLSLVDVVITPTVRLKGYRVECLFSDDLTDDMSDSTLDKLFIDRNSLLTVVECIYNNDDTDKGCTISSIAGRIARDDMDIFMIVSNYDVRCRQLFDVSTDSEHNLIYSLTDRGAEYYLKNRNDLLVF